MTDRTKLAGEDISLDSVVRHILGPIRGCATDDRYQEAYRRCNDALRLASLRAQAPAGAGWQPIESAPKEGDPVLLFKPDERRSGDYIIVGYWGDWPGSGECWIACAGSCLRQPTHWMPLPSPPGASPSPPVRVTEEDGPLKLDTDRQVFFYEQDFYVLSNFSSFTLHWRDQRMLCSEVAYQFEKFCGVEGREAQTARVTILSAVSAHEAFKVAETLKHHRRRNWEQVRVGIMRDILRAKVEQHPYVRRKLLATGDRDLVENSWRDDFWGWGPNRDGMNMLGKLWMEIRAELREADGRAVLALLEGKDGEGELARDKK